MPAPARRVTLSLSLPPQPRCWQELRVISDAWLTAKKLREERFRSAASTPTEPLVAGAGALRRVIGRLANKPDHAQARVGSIDIMRHAGDARRHHGVPVHQADAATEVAGLRAFFAGHGALVRPVPNAAAAWDRFGNLIYRHGGALPQFRGCAPSQVRSRLGAALSGDLRDAAAAIGRCQSA